MRSVVRQIVRLAFSAAAAVFSSSAISDYVVNQIDYADPNTWLHSEGRRLYLLLAFGEA